MKTNSSCCGGGAMTSCDSAIAELPRYYPRQLITPDDLTLEQNYFRDRMRRHNRLLHGWGVVCGALICPVTTKDTDGAVSVAPWQVQVQMGYVLGPYGDEIILDCPRTVDLRSNGVSGVTGDPCIDVPDPWCSQVTVPRSGGTLYIAVKYKQSMTRPVRVQPLGCGCDDNTCECSRWHDGYEIGVLTCCPTEGQTPPSRDDLFRGDVANCIPACPDCPPEPWVVLGSVQVGSDGSINVIDNRDCRRLVGSLGSFWWKCNDVSTTITEVSDPPNVPKHPVPITIGDPPTTIIVTGTNLDPAATYTFGNGILVTTPTATAGASAGTSITLTVKADTSADVGFHTLVVLNKDCSTTTFTQAISVVSNAPTGALVDTSRVRASLKSVRPPNKPASTVKPQDKANAPRPAKDGG